MPIDVIGNKRENEGSSKIARMAARKMFLDVSSSSSNSIKLTSRTAQDRVVLASTFKLSSIIAPICSKMTCSFYTTYIFRVIFSNFIIDIQMFYINILKYTHQAFLLVIIVRKRRIYHARICTRNFSMFYLRTNVRVKVFYAKCWNTFASHCIHFSQCYTFGDYLRANRVKK